MPPRQRNTPVKQEDLEEPDAQLLVGKSVTAPGDLFHSPGEKYHGVVVGTPNSKSKNHHTRCYVRFEGDDTQYWFPSKEVASWVDGKAEKRSRLAVSSMRDLPSSDEQPATSGYDTAEPTDEEPEADEEEEHPPGMRASALSVARGAEYSIPIGVTLLVLVAAGLIWFFAQLWVSERRLSRGS